MPVSTGVRLQFSRHRRGDAQTAGDDLMVRDSTILTAFETIAKTTPAREPSPGQILLYAWRVERIRRICCLTVRWEPRATWKLTANPSYDRERLGTRKLTLSLSPYRNKPKSPPKQCINDHCQKHPAIIIELVGQANRP